MDTVINMPVGRTTIRRTNEPALDRHAGQREHVTGRCARCQRNSGYNQRHPARLTRAGDRNTLSRYAGRRVA